MTSCIMTTCNTPLPHSSVVRRVRLLLCGCDGASDADSNPRRVHSVGYRSQYHHGEIPFQTSSATGTTVCLVFVYLLFVC